MSYNHALLNVEIDTEDLLNASSTMETSKSLGPDDIYPIMVKILASLFNISLQGLDPVDWKSVNIIPIFKTGDRNLPKNYRLVSLTSIVGKMLKNII